MERANGSRVETCVVAASPFDGCVSETALVRSHRGSEQNALALVIPTGFEPVTLRLGI